MYSFRTYICYPRTLFFLHRFFLSCEKKKRQTKNLYDPSAIRLATKTPLAEAWLREWVMPLPSPMM